MSDLNASEGRSYIRVLCVDDSAAVLGITKGILEEEGTLKVETALSVNEAFLKLSDGDFDVIVSDYEMPEKNGLDFLRELKEKKVDIPFILFTGKGREEVAIKSLNLGAEYYINKHGSPETVYGELIYSITLLAKRKKVENELKQKREILNSVTENIGAGLAIIGRNYHVVWANRMLKSVGGSDTEGKVCYSTFNKLDHVCPDCGAKKIFEGSSSFDVHEYQTTDSKGEPFFVELIVTPLKDDKGNVTAALELAVPVNERKKVEGMLKNGNNRLETIVLNAPIGIATSDSKMVFLSANPAFCKIVGFSEDELQKLTFKNITHPDDIPESNILMEKLVSGSIPFFSEEKRYIKKDGTMVNGKITVSAIRDKEGKPTSYVAELEDITQRKKNEEAMRLSEKKYRDLINGMNDTAWVVNFDAKFIDVNDAAVNVMGYSRAELLSMGPSDIDAHLSKEQINTLFRQIPSETKKIFETIHTTKYGKTIPVEINSSLIMYQGKQAVLSIARNITERNKLNDALRRSNARFDEVMNHVEEFVWEVDAAGVYTYASSAVEKMLGYAPEEVVGKKRFYDFFHPDEKEEFKKAAFSIFDKKEAFKGFVNQNVAKDGTLVWLSTSGVPIVADDGKLIGYRGADENITERKKMEAKLVTYSSLQATIAELGQYALVQTDRDTFMTQMVCKVANVLEVEYCKVLELLPDGNKFLLRAGAGWKKGLVGNATVETDRQSQAGYTLLSAEPVIVKDLRTEKRFSGPPLLHDHNVVSGLSVIIGRGEKSYGVLGAHTTRQRDFSEDEVNFVLSIAALLAEFLERKKVEEQLRENSDKLGLMNEKLNVVGSLTRHDVGNNLMSAKSYLHLLKKHTEDKPELAKYFDGIESALVSSDNLFEFSRLYQKIGLEKSTIIDVFQCFNQPAMLFPSIHKVRVVNECQGLKVVADSLLRQIFYNLIDNSLKHGEKVTQIRLHYTKEGDEVKLVYEDDGVGIPKADKPKLFTAGFSTGKSMGIGLHLIDKLIDVYGWSIQEDGAPGEGAKFTITIPRIGKNGKENYQITE